ncbi:unannotated protein [freshwater metagenome]|uniref:Unannotated protein n=1 Tax=freshwater metagenome TaxID=449393 RepID=A0A6J6CEE8_9ZZZZ
MNVFWAFDFGNHDDIELVAHFANEHLEVIKNPRRVQAVDSGPELRVSHRNCLCHLHEPLTGGLFCVHGDGVF